MCAAKLFSEAWYAVSKKRLRTTVLLSIIGGYRGEKDSYDVVSMRKMFENFGIEKNSSKSLSFVHENEWENEE